MMDLSTYPQTHTDRLLLIPDHIFELKRRNLEHYSNSQDPPITATWVWLILVPVGVISIRSQKATGKILPENVDISMHCFCST